MFITKNINREVKHRVYGKREFVTRDQVFYLHIRFAVHYNYTKKAVDSRHFYP